MNFSKFISYVFHPVFIPLIILLTIFNFTPILLNSSSDNFCIKSLYILFVLVCTILPILTSIVLVKLKLIGSFEMHENKDRIFPLIMNGIYLIIGGIFNNSCLNFFPFVKLFFLGLIVLTIFALVISFFWKISLHTLAAGNMIAVFVSSNYLIETNLFLIFVALFFAVIITFSRYNEDAHSIPQLILGLTIGFCTQIFLLLNQSSIITSII